MVDVAHPQATELAAFANGTLEPGRRGEVAEHLRACDSCRAVMLTPTAAGEGTRRVAGDWRATGGRATQTQTQGELAEPRDLPEIGAIVADKYRVDGVLGRGGMGVVLSAQHVELGQRVALKVLRSALSHDVQRFLREAQTCVQLRGEHVVRVFDLGRLPGGSPYFVMELLQGEDLARVLRRGPLPVPAAIRCIIEACAGLAEAHAAGIVHRDLKPANLFLETRPDAEPRLKVLDFGISKWLPQHDAFSGASTNMTAGDVVMGSMLYMSPEQLRASRDVDVRSDVWSLGVILYELLTGESPFTAESPAAVAIRIATAAPEPMSAHVTGVPKQLEAIVSRCLEKERDARYPTVTALADALRRLVASGDLNGLPTQPPAAPGPKLAMLAAAVALAACAALAILLPSRTRDPATTQSAAAHGQAGAGSSEAAALSSQAARDEAAAAAVSGAAAAVSREAARHDTAAGSGSDGSVRANPGGQPSTAATPQPPPQPSAASQRNSVARDAGSSKPPAPEKRRKSDLDIGEILPP